MRYILAVSDYVEPEALQALLDREIGPEAKDTIVTAAQRYIQQGVQQGKCELLLSLLRQRFGDKVNADAELRIVTASAQQLEVWSARVLSAVTLTELLAD